MANPLLIVAAVVGLVSAGASYFSAKKAKEAVKSTRGSTLNKNSNIDAIPVLYGKRRLGGTRVYVSTKDVPGGDKNEFLYIALVLCEGEVESIEDIEIDGYSIAGASTPGDRFYNLLSIEKFYGTDDQAASTLLKESSAAWTSDHRLQGVAYIAIRLKYYYKSFSGIPEITAVVEGKKVYDPRTATTAYSTNPALCIRDYLTNARYGKGLSTDVIDEAAFIKAADDCDEFTVEYVEGGDTGKIFECNALLDTEQTVFENLQSLLTGCRGFLPYTQGLYGLIIDQATDPVFYFDTTSIIGGIQIKGESKADRYNRVICKFINPDANWQEDTAVYPDAGSSEEATLLAEDNGTLLQGEFDLDTISNYYAARDFARIFLKRSRNAMRVAFTATSEALELSVADVVLVTHPTPGFEDKPFQVEEITLNYDGTCNVSLVEYDESIYTYDPSAEQVTYPDTSLPDPFTVAAPTSLVITEHNYVGEGAVLFQETIVSWTASADSFVIEYELQYKRVEDEAYLSRLTREPRLVFNGALIGQEYDVRIRAINSIGSISDWLEGSYTITGELSPLDPAGVSPTDLSLTAEVVLNSSGQYVANLVFEFTEPDDSRVLAYEAEYQLARHGEWKPLFNSRKTRHEWAAAELGTYQVRVRTVYLQGQLFSDWAATSEDVLGTYGTLTTIGISDPIDPKLYVTLDRQNLRADIRVKTGFNVGSGVMPEKFIILYSLDDIPNQLIISSDAGSKLYLGSVNIEGSFTLPVESGSSTVAVKYSDPSDLVDVDLSGMWWFRVESGVNGNTPYRKVTEVDTSTLYINSASPFGFTPQAGDTIRIIEVSYHDSRLPEFSLGYAYNPNSPQVTGEVIRHNGISYDGSYYVDVAERGAEGTTQATQTGKTFAYYPAFGADTQIVEINMEEFSEVGGVLTYAGNVPVRLPSNFSWGAVTCCFVRRGTTADGAAWVRSNIVPLTNAGPA